MSHDLPQWGSLLIIPAGAVVLFLLKKFIFRLLRKWTERTEGKWDDLIVEALDRPVTLFLLAGVVGLLPPFLSLSDNWQRTIGLLARLLAIFGFALFIQKILLELHRRYVSNHESFKNYSSLIRVFITIGVYALFLLIFLDTAGISITPIIASLGVGSIAIALALQDALANLFSGFYILIDKPVRVGDFVKLESGDCGYVESIGWRGVRIRLLPNNIVVIPNSKLSGSVITNYHYPDKEMAFTVDVGVDYSSSLEKVETVTVEIARDVMKSVTGGIPGFEPVVRFHTFGDSSINFSVALRAREYTDQFLLKHEFIKRLHQRYQKEGISIPFPVRTVYLQKET
ncbi:MAG: mechanosensitive ion channel [Deltaproteobacteria bacterium]|nr:mechanosensitive ion channel [Deltaproteobacteria bacterium]